MAVAEKKESFWKRHLVALILGGFGVLLLVIVAGQLLDQGDVSSGSPRCRREWAYVMCLLFVWFDAVIPIFPGETTLSAASTIAAGGGLTLGLVMVAGAIGAILGDTSLFWIARLNTAKMQPHLDKALENPKVRVAWESLERSPGLLIVAGRYVPGMRFAVNASMGLSHIPIPPLPRLVDPQRSPLVGLHVRAGVLGVDDARRFSACIARHLLAHHVRVPWPRSTSSRKRRSRKRRVPGRPTQKPNRRSRRPPPDPGS